MKTHKHLLTLTQEIHYKAYRHFLIDPWEM